LEVKKILLPRKEAEKKTDLRKVPESVKEIRLIYIGDFDIRPCRDPHVDNTSEIGKFKILKVKKAGKNRYRFLFRV